MRLPRERGDSLPSRASRSMSPCRITVRLRRCRARSRPRFWTEGHSLTTTRSHKSEQPASRTAISADTDLWIRQFIKQFELHVLDANHDLTPDASLSESHVATARAILATYLESVLELDSVMGGNGHAVRPERPVHCVSVVLRTGANGGKRRGSRGQARGLSFAA